MQIGAQLYTVHNHTKTLEDLSLSMKKIADIGYKNVQVSGVCPYEPEWMRDELQKNGLICAMTHIAPAQFDELGVKKVIANHAVFGCRNIGIGSMPKLGESANNTLENYKLFRDKFLPIAKELREEGCILHFHNHYGEFQGEFAEKSAIDMMLEDFPEDTLAITLDLGWAAFANQDVIKLIEKLNGRLSRIHLKDFRRAIPEGIKESRAYQRPVFEGELDYDGYIKALAKTDCEYMLVEMDSTYDEDEFECLRRSYVNVTERFPEAK